jgi:outer membrane lipoprotein-sorting protein
MNRRTLLIAAIGLPLLATLARADEAAPAPSAQDRADIARVQAYLNGIHTLKARFLQTAPDGATTQGTAWLERPGRMRFEYDKPSPLLLVAGHGNVVFHDAQLEQTSTIPLDKTPLGILLAPDVDLTGSVTVQDITRLPGQIEITLARMATPGDGQLTLTLADNPLLLRSWVVTDAQHNQTRVSLFDVDLGGSFAPSLFDFTDPNLPASQGKGG